MTFTYDGDGNRVAKTVGGVTTQFLVDTVNPTGYAQVMDELTNGSVSRTYTYGLDLISQRLTTNGQGQSFYGYDGHGSVRLLTDDSGAVTDSYDYDAFGNLINQTGSTPNNYLFAGEQYDWDLGLYYNRARYLDVRVGRFSGMDEYEGDWRFPLSLHKYSYAICDPANMEDSSGNAPTSVLEAEGVAGISMGLDAAILTTLRSAVLVGFGLYNTVFLKQTKDPDAIPFAVAVAIQRRALTAELKKKLDEFSDDYVYFLHGTSMESAADINVFGVSKDKALANSRGSLIPGAFFTVLLEPDPVSAVELASSFAQSKPAPHVIMVGKLPRSVFNSLTAGNHSSTRALVGGGYAETVFYEPAFPVLDSYNLTRWAIAPIP